MGTTGVAVVEDLIFDVGMHSGQDTDYYLAKGYRVVAFEANPELVRHCRDRFAAAIEGGRLTIVEGAIADSARAEATFYMPLQGDMSALGSIDRAWLETKRARVPVEEITVTTVDFSACIEKFGMPHYLKVDIEGADRLCLEALSAFDARPAWLSLEAERRDFALLCEELDLLERLGYEQFMAVPQGVKGRTLITETRCGEPIEYHFEWSASGPFGEDLSGKWLSRAALQRRYRWAFWRTRLNRRLRQTERGRRLSVQLFRRFQSLRGTYYDTHAKRAIS